MKKNENRPSLGYWVCRWIERRLVHAEGDYYGKPFKLRPWQEAFIWRAYEVRPDARGPEDQWRKYRRALLGLAKGGGKTELAAALAVAELAGPVCFAGWEEPGVPKHPVPRKSPDIPVAACSFDQADLLFGAARTMVSEGDLAAAYDVFDTEIQRKSGPGRLYRVHSSSGSNEGRKPTAYFVDELHEFLGNKRKLHEVLERGTAKRRNTWWLAISTAGFDLDSALGQLYQHGKRVEDGGVEDPEFLFEWHEAPEALDLEDEDERREAIIAANPGTGEDGFTPLENALRKWHEIPEHQWRRYYANQWVEMPDTWIPREIWDAAADPDRVVPEDAPITLGFDGAYNRDSTALVGCTVDEPHLFVCGLWERPEGAAEWSVDQDDVLGRIKEMLGTYDVQRIAIDDTFEKIWSRDFETLAEKGVEVEEWPTRSRARQVPANAQMYGAIRDRELTHDGDPDLARHVTNTVTKGTAKGPYITKEAPGSTRRIDLAVASVIAFDVALRHAPTRSRYEEEGAELGYFDVRY